jgi:hypothetical protein
MAGSTLSEAAALLRAGDWQRAHEIAQDDPSPLGSWLHGIVHRAEGDRGNARYWYRQAGRSYSDSATVDEELDAFERALAAS